MKDLLQDYSTEVEYNNQKTNLLNKISFIDKELDKCYELQKYESEFYDRKEYHDSRITFIVKHSKELEDEIFNLKVKENLFKEVEKDTPSDIPLTSFSILFARYKGNLETVVHGARALDTLEDGDTILISEGCTHHRQCDDIGTVKLPRWVREYTGKDIDFEFTSGTEFPLKLNHYKMIIHCGGCMLNEREMKYRLKCAGDASVPITNYGTAIAYMKGILERSIEIFPQLRK